MLVNVLFVLLLGAQKDIVVYPVLNGNKSLKQVCHHCLLEFMKFLRRIQFRVFTRFFVVEIHHKVTEHRIAEKLEDIVGLEDHFCPVLVFNAKGFVHQGL